MKNYRFELIWITITILIAGTAYLKFGNQSAREMFDIQCPDLVTALQGEC